MSIDQARHRAEMLERQHSDGLPEPSPSGTPVQRFRIKSVEHDYLVCRTWDGETEGEEDIHVAKPFSLRRTPFAADGVVAYDANPASQKRTISEDGFPDEVQYITPLYMGDVGSGDYVTTLDEIWAIQASTGVVVDGGDEDDVPVAWLDLNNDARTWAADANP